MSHEEPSSRRLVMEVARREITTRLRTKAFAISTIAILALAGAYLALTAFANSHQSSDSIGFTPSTAQLTSTTRTVAAASGYRVAVQDVADESAAEGDVRSGHLDALVTGSVDAPVVIVQTSLDPGLRDALVAAVQHVVLDQQLTAAHADPAAVDAAVAGASVSVSSLETADPDAGSRLGIGIVAAILLYISLTIYGQTVAQGVVEEKAGRVVELLLPALRPWQLMLGKVLGIATVGLIQLVIFIGVGMAAGKETGALHLPASVAVSTAVWSVAWYVIGFLMYAFVCAGAAALVSRQEEVANTVAPVMMLLFVPFATGIALLPRDPHNQVLAVMSLVPPFSPVLMPVREALGVVPIWEAAFATTLSVLTVAGLIWLAGRVYGYAILRTGSRVRLGHAFGRAA